MNCEKELKTKAKDCMCTKLSKMTQFWDLYNFSSGITTPDLDTAYHK